MDIKIVSDAEMREMEKDMFCGVFKKSSVNEIPINKLYMAKTKPNAIIPTKREEDAGRDIYTCETETIVIEPCSTRLVDTGIAIACNKAWFPKFFDKGGMGSKGIIVGAGVGDSGYRDGYFIPLINTNKDKWLVITSQSKEAVAESSVFDMLESKFNINMILAGGVVIAGEGSRYINKKNCIIKYLNKAITQFVMLPVPPLEDEEISWDKLKAITSERGIGKLGSSNK
ncbi:deoxyuridine 5'-triphosphate nucleotidohydrolase [Clostridium sp. FP2]|uniref:deoxyuridine 5'-triphosphate nucleotidohydrolase n=1 Tax=Clostridium sp. FP2 TaxID=2724481 RepID=UPI001CCC26FD|nr:deoxyuridine 5'-triphosphate nucleotidohydrolase [Clostridium sp. FP2]MBZ9622963.1 deoxyuridine 5'-triphosphate nucleotidohydrolase [Clostridium sp. FP2]